MHFYTMDNVMMTRGRHSATLVLTPTTVSTAVATQKTGNATREDIVLWELTQPTALASPAGTTATANVTRGLIVSKERTLPTAPVRISTTTNVTKA